MDAKPKKTNRMTKPKATMTIKDIQEELGVSRKVATAWSKQYLHYKLIGRRYLFSRQEFLEIINQQEDVIFEVNY